MVYLDSFPIQVSQCPLKKKAFFGTTWDHMFRPLGPWTWLSETMTIIFTIWQAASEPPVSRFAEGVAQITIEAGGFPTHGRGRGPFMATMVKIAM